MKRNECSRKRHYSTFVMALLAFITLFLLGGVRQVQAQWSPPDSTTGSTNYPNGNVGIGTTSPNEKLVTIGNNLGGNIVNHTQLFSTYDSQSNVISELGYGTATALDTPFASYVLSKNLTGTSNLIGEIAFANSSISNGSEKRIAALASFTDGATNSGTVQFYTSNAGTFGERLRIDHTGNVGIGITNPSQKLDIGGNLSIYGATVINSNRIFSARSSFNTYTADGVWNTQATPSTIFTPSSSINTGFIFGYEDEGSGQYTPSLGLSVPTTATDNARVLQVRHFGGSSPESYNRFEVNASGKLSWGTGTGTVDASLGRSGTATLGVTGGFNVSGNVAVGGNTNINGTLTATGGITGTTINATYQDVAEWVPATHALSAGTVVVLNPTKSNEVMASHKAYDTGVAGVVSPHPGLTLGEAGKDKALVATTGRVKVKVDATRAPIHVGDLLVTSDQEGVAMKSVPLNLGGTEIHRPGTLIGKALEPLESGRGEILVLLSLQ